MPRIFSMRDKFDFSFPYLYCFQGPPLFLVTPAHLIFPSLFVLMIIYVLCRLISNPAFLLSLINSYSISLEFSKLSVTNARSSARRRLFNISPSTFIPFTWIVWGKVDHLVARLSLSQNIPPPHLWLSSLLGFYTFLVLPQYIFLGPPVLIMGSAWNFGLWNQTLLKNQILEYDFFVTRLIFLLAAL